ncbi:MAG: glycosyltransferase family 9 protein [Succinivibrionaceae bacterium]
MSEKIKKNVCFIRLSALGDCVNALGAIQLFQKNNPDYNVYWIIGKNEYTLFSNIKNINFIIFDKKNGLKEYFKIKKLLKNIYFDILFHMQYSLRSNLITLFIKADIKIGFNKERSEDFQRYFVNKMIQKPNSPHVIDGFIEFVKPYCHQIKNNENSYVYDIDIPLSAEESSKYNYLFKNKTIAISPCSSKEYKDWSIIGYVEIIKYIQNKGFDIILIGGSSKREEIVGQRIIENFKDSNVKITNLIGKTTLKELVGVIKQATALISPDSGPVHIANAVHTPVISLYAYHDPKRVGPYNFQRFVVSIYDKIIKEEYPNIPPEKLKWRTRVHKKHATLEISSDMVKNKFDQVCDYIEEINK